jgi:hypothetical protein
MKKFILLVREFEKEREREKVVSELTPDTYLSALLLKKEIMKTGFDECRAERSCKLK